MLPAIRTLTASGDRYYRDWRLVAKLFAALGAIEGSAQLLGHYIVCTLARRGTPTRPQSHEAGGSQVCMAHEVFPRARAESGGDQRDGGSGGGTSSIPSRGG